jgi:hypothetical protein
MCFLDLQGKPEEIREQYLSKIYRNPMQALFSFPWLHLKNFATTTAKRDPYSPQKAYQVLVRFPMISLHFSFARIDATKLI